MEGEHSTQARCANCGTALRGEWCHACGQKRYVEGDRRLGHLLGEAWRVMTDLDGRFWGSLGALLFQPGRLARDYLRGARARWLSPLTLFLLANLLYFLAPGLTDFSLPFHNQVPGDVAVAAVDPEERMPVEMRKRLESWDGQFHTPWSGDWVRSLIETRNAEARTLSDGVQGYSAADLAVAYDLRASEVGKLLIFLHVPFLALALWLLFPRRRLYFAEHMVLGLHLFTFVVLLVELVILPFGFVGRHWLGFQAFPTEFKLLATAILLAYFSASVQRVYETGWPRALVSGALLMVVLMAANMIVYRALQFAVVMLMV